MDMGIVRGLITLLVLVLFVGIWAWSWSRNRHSEFDAAARMPLGDDTSPPGAAELKEKQS
jgi:cytochrome c oxidase cbb3-type subunit 4